MPNSGGSGDVIRRREAPALLSLIDVVAAGEDSVLPPGRRDASGFWYPASCRNPSELFTPYQRSLQEKQRTVHRERRQRKAASGTGVSDPDPDSAGLCDQPIPLPPPRPEAPES